MAKCKGSGSTRSDRDADFWILHGDNLLAKMKNRRTIGKRISKYLSLLIEASNSGNNDKVEAYQAELNSEKYNLKDDWTTWINRSNQKVKDRKRRKLYINEQSAELTKNMANEMSSSRFISDLMTCFKSIGVESASDLYDINEQLEPYKDAIKTKVSNVLHVQDSPITPSIVNIISAITTALKENKIENFSSLNLLLSKSKKLTSSYENIRLKEKEIENTLDSISLNNEILSRDKAIAKMTKELASLKAKNENLKTRIPKPRTKKSFGLKR